MGALAILPWGRIALVAGIFLAGFGSGWQLNGWRLGSQIGPLEAEISRLQARTSILESANAQCSESVKSANEATDRLLAAGKARESRAAKAIEEARRASAGLATDILALRAAKSPENASCEVQAAAAAKLIADEIRGRK